MKKNIKLLSILATVGIASTLTLTAGCGGCGSCGSQKHAEHKHNIVETAAESGNFNTLLTAAKVAGLVETLQSEGPFTVFAPTDEAFAKLPEGTLTNLLKPENKNQLVAILTYHVVPAKVMAKDVKTGNAPTINGKELTIEITEGTVTVDGIKVIATDIKCTNGVIHVVESVILPPSTT